jgi:chromosome segregation ATPase
LLQVSQAQDTNQKLKEQLQELQQDKRTLATQLSTMQLELSMLQDSNRHLKENICHSRDAVAALMQQLQSRCLVADGSSRQQLLGTVPPQVMHMSRLGCSGPAGHAHDRSGLGCH